MNKRQRGEDDEEDEREWQERAAVVKENVENQAELKTAIEHNVESSPTTEQYDPEDWDQAIYDSMRKAEEKSEAERVAELTEKLFYFTNGCFADFRHKRVYKVEVEVWSSKIGEFCIGSAEGYLFRRELCRTTFYQAMERSYSTRKLARECFDSIGHLRPALLHHPVKKGTGVWGNELSKGNFLVIHSLSLPAPLRNWSTLSAELLLRLWLRAKRLNPAVKCMFFSPQAIFGDLETRSEIDRARSRPLVAYWTMIARVFGFRRVGNTSWLCFAENHSSRKLLAEHDLDLQHSILPSSNVAIDYYNQTNPFHRSRLEWFSSGVPGARLAAEKMFKSQLPYHYLILTNSDIVAGYKLQCAIAESQQRNEPLWSRVDSDGNNVLAFAALMRRPDCVATLLGSRLGPALASARNSAGETPLEAVVEFLDQMRHWDPSFRKHQTLTSYWVFRSYSEDAMKCVRLLSQDYELDSKNMKQAVQGCSCGDCIGGYLSPTLRDLLLSGLKDMTDAFEVSRTNPSTLESLSKSDRRFSAQSETFCDLEGEPPGLSQLHGHLDRTSGLSM